jgi:hypothetical protein
MGIAGTVSGFRTPFGRRRAEAFRDGKGLVGVAGRIISQHPCGSNIESKSLRTIAVVF